MTWATQSSAWAVPLKHMLHRQQLLQICHRGMLQWLGGTGASTQAQCWSSILAGLAPGLLSSKYSTKLWEGVLE